MKEAAPMIDTVLARETSERVVVLNSEVQFAHAFFAHRPTPIKATAEVALIDAVHLALRATGHLSLRLLDVEVFHSSSIRLVGAVRSYYLKQLAQSAVKQVPGIGRITNDVEVV
jgi:osmotically-inducible protein OsmY